MLIAWFVTIIDLAAGGLASSERETASGPHETPMSRFYFALMGLGWILGGAGAQEKKITIRWYGQSFFHLTTTDGTRMVFDPHYIEQYPRNMVEAEQADFTALLRGLTPEQWAAPSLCNGWSVHDTVIHIAIHAHTTGTQRTAGLARAGFSEDRQMEPERARTSDDLIDWLASPAKLGGRFDILTQLSELVIHQQDVRRPLGTSRPL